MVARNLLRDDAAEAARQRRILTALDLSPMQVRAFRLGQVGVSTASSCSGPLGEAKRLRYRLLAHVPAQAQTLMWARERQLGRLSAIAEGREEISMQVCGAP